MIQAGNSIKTFGDSLQKISVDYLYNSIKNPKPEIINKIRQLRIIKNIDQKQYRQLKVQLPYFVCGMFNPNIRRIENFAYSEYFVVDIDHISEKGLEIGVLRKKLESDNQILMSFLSPGEDELKLLFRLSKRCYDANIFTIFYKAFLTDFSNRYYLEQVVDSRTCDVSRACFISYDPDVYFNPKADNVNLDLFFDTENSFNFFNEKKVINENLRKISSYEQPIKEDVDSDIVLKIKSILQSSHPKPHKKEVYVPERLNEIIDELQSYITETGVVIKDIINISYGKKIKALVGVKEAEVNLFYGKRGFSVVQSPRTGTSKDMNVLLSNLIESFLERYNI
jgi:hypothetical protein